MAAVARAGYSIIDVTTRGNLQVQGLHVSDLPDVIEWLDAAGLTSKQTGHDNVRNVMTHPWAGLDPAELCDVRSLCRELTELFLDDRLLSNLPRKFNVAVDGRPIPALHCWTQDTSFIAATRDNGTVAFHWLLAGTQGQNPHLAWKMPVWVTAETGAARSCSRPCMSSARTALRERRDRARLRYLIEQIGADEFLAGSKGGWGIGSIAATARSRKSRSTKTYRLVPPEAARAAGHLGFRSLSGRMTHEQLDGLALLAEQSGDGTIRTGLRPGNRDPEHRDRPPGNGDSKPESARARTRGRQHHA